MKLYRFITVALAGVVIAASCNKIDEIKPEGGTLLASQLSSNAGAMEALFNGMYIKPGKQFTAYPSSSRADDFGFIMAAISVDVEAADVVFPNSGYNWFSVCGELTSRTANYANPFIRYKVPYDEISVCNSIIATYPEDTTDPEALVNISQAKVMRAFSYLMLVPYFQFTYALAADQPCVPLVDEKTTDFTHNPRATVKELYEFMLSDLNYAVEHLEGYTRANKAKIDQQVAYGLRARVNLNMCNWQAAYDDAVAAAEGFTPATIAELTNADFAKRLSFKDISEHNWIWGYDMSTSLAQDGQYETSSSWIRSFSANGYAPACQCYAMINSILYEKIADTDVRKQWWVDDNLKSPLIDNLKWKNLDGDLAHSSDGGDSKQPFLPFTNVKFGTYTVGTDLNDEDWPYMRVEEMILIQAECQARLGKEADAITTLEGFVKTYRNPKYSAKASHCANLLDEIWFQRRIELWGEGLANNDTRRLNKPLVRFHDNTNNVPEAFRFNMPADDGWWLMRFPQGEMNTNLSIVDNTDGTSPVMDQYAELLDGVTD